MRRCWRQGKTAVWSWFVGGSLLLLLLLRLLLLLLLLLLHHLLNLLRPPRHDSERFQPATPWRRNFVVKIGEAEGLAGTGNWKSEAKDEADTLAFDNCLGKYALLSVYSLQFAVYSLQFAVFSLQSAGLDPRVPSWSLRLAVRLKELIRGGVCTAIPIYLYKYISYTTIN